MPDDDRLTWDFIREVLEVMERHGYHHSDNQHTGQAIGLIHDVARTYEGTIDAPPGGYVVVPSSQPTPPQPPGVTVSADQVKTLLTALDEAAEYKRDRAASCADCADQSCTTCQWRLRAASAYDQLTAQLLQAADPRVAAGRPPEPEHPSGVSAQPHKADKEAGQ